MVGPGCKPFGSRVQLANQAPQDRPAQARYCSRQLHHIQALDPTPYCSSFQDSFTPGERRQRRTKVSFRWGFGEAVGFSKPWKSAMVTSAASRQPLRSVCALGSWFRVYRVQGKGVTGSGREPIQYLDPPSTLY